MSRIELVKRLRTELPCKLGVANMALLKFNDDIELAKEYIQDQGLQYAAEEQMTFKILVGQRKESYPGEHAPEPLEVISNFGDEENPSFLLDKFDEYKRAREWENLAIVDVQVRMMDLMRILRPDKIVKGTIKEKAEGPPAFLTEALNQGDGTYRP